MTGLVRGRSAWVIGLGLVACGAGDPGGQAQTAVLARSCAPFDGPAVTLYLTPRPMPPSPSPPPPPYNAVSVYRALSDVLGRRFEVGPETPNLGMLQTCPAEGPCRSGGAAWIRFGGLDRDSTLVVEYHLTLPDGGSARGRVRARYRSGEGYCG